jgi:hypothetical protein
MTTPFPDRIHVPDYSGGSILNIIGSLQHSFGKPSLYPACHNLPPELLNATETTILLIIDGLGYDYLLQHAPHSSLAKNLMGKLTSVYPSTTAAAMTGFYTSLGPQNHGILSWFLYLREIGAVSTILPMLIRYNKSNLLTKDVNPTELLKISPMFPTIPFKSYCCLPTNLEKSGFNQIVTAGTTVLLYKSLEDLLKYPVNLVKNTAGKKYICMYWGDLDANGHKIGIQHPDTIAHLEELIIKIDKLCAALEATKKSVTLLITADHGLIDTTLDHTLRLDQHLDLRECLSLPICGEPRSAFCYVRPKKVDRFEHYYTFKDLLMGEQRQTLIGNHGGVSRQEMYVPLIGYFFS